MAAGTPAAEATHAFGQIRSDHRKCDGRSYCPHRRLGALAGRGTTEHRRGGAGDAAGAGLQHHRPAAVRAIRRHARQYRVLALFDWYRHVDGGDGRTGRHRFRDDAGAFHAHVGGCDRYGECRSAVDPQRLRPQRRAAGLSAGSDGCRAELRDEAGRRHGEPVPLRPAAPGRPLRRRRRDAAVGQAPRRQCADADQARRRHVRGLHRGAQEQVRRRSVRRREPRRRQWLGRSQDRGSDPQDARPTRSQFLGGPPRRNIFQGALGIGVRQEAHRGRAFPSHAVATGRCSR